jgi:hypothetical protein
VVSKFLTPVLDPWSPKIPRRWIRIARGFRRPLYSEEGTPFTPLNEVMKLTARMRWRSAVSAGHLTSHGVVTSRYACCCDDTRGHCVPLPWLSASPNFLLFEMPGGCDGTERKRLRVVWLTFLGKQIIRFDFVFIRNTTCGCFDFEALSGDRLARDLSDSWCLRVSFKISPCGPGRIIRERKRDEKSATLNTNFILKVATKRKYQERRGNNVSFTWSNQGWLDG